MRIENRTRKTLLGSRVQLAATWWARLRGYIGRSRPKNGDGLLLVPCDGIHTFWMSFPIDVLFLDEKGQVLASAGSLGPWKWGLRVRGARYVLEVPAGTIDASGTQVGDELAWRDPAPYSIAALSTPRHDEGSRSAASGGSSG